MTAALSSQPLPYSLPEPTAPVRVVFAGPATVFGAHALHAAAAGLEPRFLDVRAGTSPRTVRAMLEDAAPHVVVAFAPEVVQPAALDGLRAAVLAVTPAGAAAPDPDLVDRVLRAPGGGDGWHVRPLPVDDRLFAPVQPSRQPPRALFVGRSTEHRERMLTPAKHAHDIVHYAHGLVGEALREAMANADVGIALPEHGFPPQALLHLAAGHLLLSQPLDPAWLEPGIDYLEIGSAGELVATLTELREAPERHDGVRAHGRQKAEEHRASSVWPRVVRELVKDLSTFGTARTLHA